MLELYGIQFKIRSWVCSVEFIFECKKGTMKVLLEEMKLVVMEKNEAEDRQKSANMAGFSYFGQSGL